MDIVTDCIIIGESFGKFDINERCQISKERVQDFLDRGLMNQSAIYERYTEEISESLTSLKRSDHPTVIRDIRQLFRRLCDPKSEYLSEVTFKLLVAEKVSGSGVDASLDAPPLLFKIFSLSAFHPFPAPHNDSEQARIDEDGFVRAVCRLTLISYKHYHRRYSQKSVHGLYSGGWGPHHGWYISTRGKNYSDFRRWLFRSLAIPTSSSISSSYNTKIAVPRFIWSEDEEDEEDEGEEGDDGEEEYDSEPENFQKFAVVEDESELTIDIVDVLSECPPEVDRLTANPFRESYRVVLPSLPKHSSDLSVLFIPRIELVAFLKLIHQVQGADFAATIKGLGDEEEISWKKFDSALSKDSICIAAGVAKIFSTFLTAEDLSPII